MLVYCAATDDALPGFMDYSYKHILPACFIAPLESSFDFNDGHSFLVKLIIVVIIVNWIVINSPHFLQNLMAKMVQLSTLGWV